MMTKLITIAGRPGAGKTTVAAILSEKLAEKYTVCLIDNNRSNINIYSAESSIESINLYTCLADKESCRRAIKESAAELKRNLFFFSGGNEPLAEEEIEILKEQDIFEYVILDSGAEISGELPDINITVVNPNRFEYETAAASGERIIVVNRYIDNLEFKVNNIDFKLYFCPEIINFTNGYELSLPEENEKEMNKLIEKITGQRLENSNKKPKFRLFKL